MEIITTDKPALELGQDLATAINKHEGSVICLLSGGSALDVIEHLDIKRQKSECRTIFIMGDERGSREREINNTLQLQNRYPDHFVTNNLIETIPNEAEILPDFASRINQNFSKVFSELKNPKIFMVLGMGADGHTAGIFPLPLDQFNDTYKEDVMYASLQLDSLTRPHRASFTPSWILSNVSYIFAYAAGESKRAVLESLKNESKPIHERPAEIFKIHSKVALYTDQEL